MALCIAVSMQRQSHRLLSGMLRWPSTSCWGRRFLSTQPVRILYGSQGGTAQVFGMQLQQELEELRKGEEQFEFLELNEAAGTNETVLRKDALHVILVSVTGVGEPPDNARQFYKWLMETNEPLDMQYTLFGLGNSVAHPNHFNVIGKKIDSKLQELGAQRVYPLGLGDDGDCIEDDFDQWMEGLLTYITEGEKVEEHRQQIVEAPASSSKQDLPSAETPILAQHDPLQLKALDGFPSIHENLLHVSFYQKEVDYMMVVANDVLSVNGGEQGLRELRFQLPPDVSYETGDHTILYPRNSDCMVDAVLQLYKDADPHSIIVDGGPGYPHPTGISIYETMSHCVDLGAVPSPSMARFLLQRKEIDYKRDIALPRRTVLDLMHQSGNVAPLQDLLHLLPKIQPRYYSIASSPKRHPSQVIVTYRPVKYLSTTGNLREGVCTSHMISLTSGSHIAGAVRSNPTFRLPSDPQVPIILVAGGCGIAPIRAFLEDRLASESPLGESLLFVGFRSPSDEVYQDLVEESLARGVLTMAHTSYSGGCTSPDQRCQLVTETMREHGDMVLDWIENRGAHVYLCGGARSFGAAMEAELLHLFETRKGLGAEEATQYLRRLIAEGRLCEDLAD